MGDFNPSHYNDKFIADLVAFVAADDFQTKFEGFFVDHALDFSLNEDEHKLKYYEHYKKFSAMFESQLENFQAKKGVSQIEFFKRCREASTTDAKAKHYIQILLSSAEYETFVKLMKMMRPVAELRRLQTVTNGAITAAKLEIKSTNNSGLADSKVGHSGPPPLTGQNINSINSAESKGNQRAHESLEKAAPVPSLAEAKGAGISAVSEAVRAAPVTAETKQIAAPGAASVADEKSATAALYATSKAETTSAK